MSQEKALAKLFAQKFISRPDVKAKQSRFGTYAPDRTPFSMNDLVAHIKGDKVLGHYMVGEDDTVKLFAFDIDLEQLHPQTLPNGNPNPAYRPMLLPQTVDEYGVYGNFEEANPRQTWMSRKQGPARQMMRFQMHYLAHKMVRAIREELEIPAVAAYSGSKGVHVYGFTGKASATLARQGAAVVLAATGWNLFRGNNVYTYSNPDVFGQSNEVMNFHQYSLEVYPKQDSLEGKEKGLGNLMRLPLGVNYKSPKDRAFFVDLRAPFNELIPMDPIEALTTSDPWAYAHER